VDEIYTLGGPPGLSNAKFTSLGIGVADHFYTAGMRQPGVRYHLGLARSNTGGLWEPVVTPPWAPANAACSICSPSC
jgi:hypothetical protein